MTGVRRRSLARLAAASVLLATMSVAPVGPAQAALSLPGEFVFVQSPDRQNYYLYAANATTGVRRLLSTRRVVGKPSFSPGGSAIAFSGPYQNDETRGRYGLYIINRDGSGLRSVAAPAVAHLDPAWAPNGNEIAFTLDSRGNSESSCCSIAVVRMNGSSFRVPNTAYGRFPAWSPDSRRLAFVRPDGLYIINRNGTGRIRLATGTITTPEWSPGGSAIAYSQRTSESRSALRVVSARGGPPATRWAPDNHHVESPVWAASGGSIYVNVFQGWGDWARRSSSVYVVPTAGSPSKQLDPARHTFFLDYHSYRN